MDLPTTVDARLEVRGRVALLTLDRDDVRNALTGTALVDDLVTVVDWIEHEPGISVLVLTGAGTAFSAGGNVKDMRDNAGIFAGDTATVANAYRASIQRVPLAMHRLAVPAVAAVNGPAIGAGSDLACMCDVRIAATAAVFGQTFINLGLVSGDGGHWFLQRLLGYAKAAEMALTGRLVGAAEALAMGLVNEVVAGDALLERALAFADDLATRPPLALRETKRLLRRAADLPLATFLEHCADAQGRCHASADHAEALAAFLEKRPPRFGG